MTSMQLLICVLCSPDIPDQQARCSNRGRSHERQIGGQWAPVSAIVTKIVLQAVGWGGAGQTKPERGVGPAFVTCVSTSERGGKGVGVVPRGPPVGPCGSAVRSAPTVLDYECDGAGLGCGAAGRTKPGRRVGPAVVTCASTSERVGREGCRLCAARAAGRSCGERCVRRQLYRCGSDGVGLRLRCEGLTEPERGAVPAVVTCVSTSEWGRVLVLRRAGRRRVRRQPPCFYEYEHGGRNSWSSTRARRTRACGGTFEASRNSGLGNPGGRDIRPRLRRRRAVTWTPPPIYCRISLDFLIFQNIAP